MQMFTGCDLTMTIFNNVNLQFADFSKLALDRTSLTGVQSNNAKIAYVSGT